MKRYTISVAENAYDLLKSLKSDSRDTFSKVILRHVRKSRALEDSLNPLEDLRRFKRK